MLQHGAKVAEQMKPKNYFKRKSGQHRSKLASKIEAKSKKNDANIDRKTMHLGIDFWTDFGGFLDAKWRHVATNIDQKSMPTSNNDFLKKPCFSLGKTMISRVQGIEVGGKKR